MSGDGGWLQRGLLEGLNFALGLTASISIPMLHCSCQWNGTFFSVNSLSFFSLFPGIIIIIIIIIIIYRTLNFFLFYLHGYINIDKRER